MINVAAGICSVLILALLTVRGCDFLAPRRPSCCLVPSMSLQMLISASRVSSTLASRGQTPASCSPRTLSSPRSTASGRYSSELPTGQPSGISHLLQIMSLTPTIRSNCSRQTHIMEASARVFVVRKVLLPEGVLAPLVHEFILLAHPGAFRRPYDAHV